MFLLVFYYTWWDDEEWEEASRRRVWDQKMTLGLIWTRVPLGTQTCRWYGHCSLFPLRSPMSNFYLTPTQWLSWCDGRRILWRLQTLISLLNFKRHTRHNCDVFYLQSSPYSFQLKKNIVLLTKPCEFTYKPQDRNQQWSAVCVTLTCQADWQAHFSFVSSTRCFRSNSVSEVFRLFFTPECFFNQ